MPESFDERLRDWQVAWRNRHVATKEQGKHSGREREWILPETGWEQGLWPGIRSGTPDALKSYLKQHRIQRHTGSNNLKSSWILCANLYFPFRATDQGRALLAGFLRKHVAEEVRSLDAVELEYSEDGPLHPSALLGETGGSRGSGQTSPDVAFIVNGGKGLVLTESKLGEHSFYGCSARTYKGSTQRAANPNASRCDNALAVLANPRDQCHQAAWGRKYWEILHPVANHDIWKDLAHCPAAHAGYQLFRQQALAEGIANSGNYNLVVSCVAMDARNDVLADSLKATGVPRVAEWGRMFHGRARFAVFTHQQWFEWVKAHGSSKWVEWVSWMADRYGFEAESFGHPSSNRRDPTA